MSPRLSATLRSARFRNSAPVFAALGDENRLRLVAFLCGGGASSIAQLTLGTEITRQGVTKHLQVLARVGLVRDVRAGRERLWELEAGPLDEARRSLELIAAQWDHALGRLKALLEDDSQDFRSSS